MVGLISSLPILVSPFAAPIGGKLADRYSRKVVLFWTRFSAASIFVLMALAVNLDISPIVLIGALSVTLGIFGGMEGPSGRNMIVDIIGRSRIAQGNAMAELFNGIVNALVPALAAILLTLFTITQLFWTLPLLQYFASVLILILVFNLPPQKKLSDNLNRSSLRDSLSYAYGNPKLRAILILGMSTVIWGVTQPLIPVFCRDVLNLSGIGYSLVTSANFVGAIFGSFILLAFGAKLATGKVMSFCMIIFSLLMFSFFISSNAYMAAFLLLSSNIFITIWIALVFTSLQSLSEEIYMGRVVSFFMTMFGLIGVGFIVGGYMGDKIGITATVAITVIIIILLNLAVLFLSKSYREMKVIS